jgi:phosphoglycerate-specific signal transduction histidine kinase
MKTFDNRNRRVIPSITDLTRKKITTAELKDYSLKSVVTLQWHLNQASKRDKIIQLNINGQTALVDSEELLAYLRLI